MVDGLSQPLIPAPGVPTATTASINVQPQPAKPKSFFGRLFRGRLNRISYFFGPLILEIIASLLTAIISGGFLLTGLVKMSEVFAFAYFVSFILSIFVFIYTLSFTVRRAHDIGKRWTFLLWGLIPLVNIAVSLIILFKGGNKEDNKYGPITKPGIHLGELLGID